MLKNAWYTFGKSKCLNVTTHILHISVCHLDARMNRWICVYIFTLFGISQNFQIRTFENWNLVMCLGTFSAYPKIQIWGKVENRKNPGFWPSPAPGDLIWVTLGQETYCRLVSPMDPGPNWERFPHIQKSRYGEKTKIWKSCFFSRIFSEICSPAKQHWTCSTLIKLRTTLVSPG